jgi:hypothetical protein
MQQQQEATSVERIAGAHEHAWQQQLLDKHIHTSLSGRAIRTG